MKKVLSIMMMVVMILSMVSTVVLAGEASLDPKDITANLSSSGIGDVQEIGKEVLGIIQVAGSIIAVIILVVLGIKYMMGSAEEKAEYKKTLIPYIVGAILIFAASNIAGIVYGWASTIGS